MAQDNEKRKKFWEDDEEELPSLAARRAQTTEKPLQGIVGSDIIDQKIHEAKTLMDQTHQLYLQYFSGVERRTPVEKIKLLESKIAELQRLSTSITTARFKVSGFLSQYSTMKDLWERKMRDKERK